MFPSKEEISEVIYYDPVKGIVHRTEVFSDIQEFMETTDHLIGVAGKFYRLLDLLWILSDRPVDDLKDKHIKSLDPHSENKYRYAMLCVDQESVRISTDVKFRGKGFVEQKRNGEYTGRYQSQFKFRGKLYCAGVHDSQAEAYDASLRKLEFLAKGSSDKSETGRIVKKRELPSYVYPYKDGKFKVIVRKNGRLNYLGIYEKLEDAVVARDEVLNA